MMAAELLSTWLSFVACRRRAVAIKQVVSWGPTCPICGQGNDNCPFSKVGFGCWERNQVPTKVEKLLHRGCELLSSLEFQYAEISFDKALDVDGRDWRAHYGKVLAIRGQGRYFVAFSAARKGNE